MSHFWELVPRLPRTLANPIFLKVSSLLILRYTRATHKDWSKIGHLLISANSEGNPNLELGCHS